MTIEEAVKHCRDAAADHPVPAGDRNVALWTPLLLAAIEERQAEWRKAYEAMDDKTAANLAMQLCREASYDPWEICGKSGTLAGCVIPAVTGEIAAAVSLRHSFTQFKPLWAFYLDDAQRIVRALKQTP